MASNTIKMKDLPHVDIDIINACRKEDVCTARAILVFWCEEAGFSVESLVKCCECNHPDSNGHRLFAPRIREFVKSLL